MQRWYVSTWGNVRRFRMLSGYRRVALLVVLLVVATIQPAGSPAAHADDLADLPELGAVVVDDPLTATGVVRTTPCPTGRVGADFVPIGIRIKVTGRCSESSSAGLRVIGRGLMMGDGDVTADVTVLEGIERARISLYVRDQAGPGNANGYRLSLEPARGRAEIRRTDGETGILLAERTDREPIPAGAWTRLALRVEGGRLWAIVNDEPIMSAADDTYASGTVSVATTRLGPVEDEAPTVAVWRNLRVTALASGDASRAPSYQPPAPPPAASAAAPSPAGAFVPPVGVPPQPGMVIVQDSPGQRGLIPGGFCRTGRGSGEVVDEGILLRTTGRCTEDSTAAQAGTRLPWLTVPDGELRFELKVVKGFSRAFLSILTRVTLDPPGGGYFFGINLAEGAAFVTRPRTDQGSRTLTQRRDLARLLRPDDWNSVAVRMNGSSLWLILNDQPVLFGHRRDRRHRCRHAVGRAKRQCRRRGRSCHGLA